MTNSRAKIRSKGDRLVDADAFGLRRKTDWGAAALYAGYAEARAYISRITRHVVRGVLERHLADVDDILDLGSGEGELVAYAPAAMRPRFIQSDVAVGPLRRNPYDTRKEFVDVFDIPRADDTVAAITSLSVINAIPYLGDALRELHRVLRAGGILVAFYDLKPNFPGVMTHLVDDVLFPATVMESGFPLHSAYLKVCRRELEQRLAGLGRTGPGSCGVKEDEVAHLEKYLEDPATWLDHCQTRGDKAARLERNRNYLQLLERCGVEVELLHPVEAFNAILEQEAEMAGFRIDREATGLVSAHMDVPRAELPASFPPGANVAYYDFLFYAPANSDEVAPGRVRIISSVYTLVACKARVC